MKAKVTTPPVPKFTPVTLEITFESQEEVDTFYKVINIAPYYMGKLLKRVGGPTINTSVWDTINYKLYNVIKEYKK
jgi:hypothetical protein